MLKNRLIDVLGSDARHLREGRPFFVAMAQPGKIGTAKKLDVIN